jgi:hypothetical protein
VWAPAPAKPYYTITFNRNAGTGVFEKRIAVPTETTEGEEGETQYGQFKIAATYTVAGDAVTQDPIIPEDFTREHYESDGWEDVTGKSVAVSGDTVFEGDTQLYQKWTAKTFTVKFNLNGKSGNTPAEITGVDEAKSAKGGLKEAGKTLPTGEDSSEEYEFRYWMDKPVGGNVINAATPLFPASDAAESREVTLYAHWVAENSVERAFNYTGAPQTWTGPTTGTYKIEVWGAGGDNPSGNQGGHGGYVGGNIALTAGTELYIYVGGQGPANDNNKKKDRQNGGWNGGGLSGGTSGPLVTRGGGGHGATDVRTVSGTWNDETSLNSRIIVAGGGGGGAGGGGYKGSAGNGGYGIAAGGNGYADKDNEGHGTAGGGSLNNGGESTKLQNATVMDGSLGAGGNGGRSKRGGGGGGGGYYGGGGGTTDNSEGVKDLPGGGGGGSSWAKTSGEGLKFIENTIIPAKTDAVDGGGNNTGHGRVMITLVSDSGTN